MSDRWGRHKADITAPPSNGFVITPDDDNDLPHVTRAIYVGGAGTLVVDFVGYEDDPGAEDVPFEVAAGQTLIGRFVRVKETSDASALVGLY